MSCQTTNKEFSGVLNGKLIILAKLLGTIGIVVGIDHQRLVCKKCARKINCFKLLPSYNKYLRLLWKGVSTASLPSFYCGG